MDTIIIVIILIVIVISIGLFYYYYHVSSDNEIVLISEETIFDNDFENIIQIANLVTNRNTLYIPKLGYGLTFIWDMYIPNLNSNLEWTSGFNILKPIFTMNDSPQIAYHPKKNYLSIILKYRDNPFRSQYAEIKIDNIKQQKWNKYILVINGRTIQLYINDKLISAQILPSLPVIYDINSELILGQKNNNFLGKIRNFKMLPYPVNDITNL